ncbi:MAG TPA: hypothetical protein VKS21_05220 [Spirochaetota bacterium]|nr:hypothetical protein [Spirochaetota bacterium]
MEMYINNQKINFSFTDEKNVLDIVNSIEKWVGKDNNIIAEFNINGKDYYSIEAEDLKKIKPETVNIIKFKVLSVPSYAVAVMLELNNYFTNMKKVFANELTPEKYGMAVNGLQWCKKTFSSVLTVLKLQAEGAFILKDMHEMEVELFRLKNRNEKNCSDVMQKLIKVLMEKMHFFCIKINIKILEKNLQSLSLNNIPEVAEDSYKLLDMTEDILVRAAEKMQSGKDAEALGLIRDIMELFIIFSHLADKIIKIKGSDPFTLQEGNGSFKDFNSKLVAVLKTVESALKENDFVQLSDIIEYELREYTEKYKSFFQYAGSDKVE